MVPRDGHNGRDAFGGAHVELPELAAGVAVREEVPSVGCDAGESAVRAIDGRREVPWCHRLAVFGDLGECAREGADNEGIALRVLFNVLEATWVGVSRRLSCSRQR